MCLHRHRHRHIHQKNYVPPSSFARLSQDTNPDGILDIAAWNTAQVCVSVCLWGCGAVGRCGWVAVSVCLCLSVCVHSTVAIWVCKAVGREEKEKEKEKEKERFCNIAEQFVCMFAARNPAQVRISRKLRESESDSESESERARERESERTRERESERARQRDSESESEREREREKREREIMRALRVSTWTVCVSLFYLTRALALDFLQEGGASCATSAQVSPVLSAVSAGEFAHAPKPLSLDASAAEGAGGAGVAGADGAGGV